MNCQTAIRAIVLAATGDLAPEDAVALTSHLEHCARCRAEEKFADLLTAALATDLEPAPGAAFTDRVLDRIRHAEAAAPRARAWMPLVPAAALLSAIGAAWVAFPLIPWQEMASALSSHLLPSLAPSIVRTSYGAMFPALLVVTTGLAAFAAREFANFMRE